MFKAARLFHFATFAALLALAAGCTQKTPATCSSSSDASNPACAIATSPGDSTGLLSLSFVDSHYYDYNTKSWITFSATTEAAGTVGGQIAYIYSSFLNLAASDAVTAAAGASAQFAANASASSGAQVPSQVPYIEFIPQPGVIYLYRWTKSDGTAAVMPTSQGQVQITNGRAIIPIVNTMFGCQLYTASSAVGLSYGNTLSLVAQIGAVTGAVKQIQFTTTFTTPNLDFNTVYSPQLLSSGTMAPPQFCVGAASFSMACRWNFYENATYTGGNTNLPFFSLVEKTGATETVPLDVQVLFAAPPVMQIVEEPFFEIPFQDDAFDLTGAVIPNRGYKFISTTLTLDNSTQNNDFSIKISLGGTQLTAASSIQYNAAAWPAGSKYNIGFAYNLTQTSTWANGWSGAPLLYPLRPACNELTTTAYAPWTTQPQEAAASAAGNFMAVCHDATNTPLTLAAGVPSCQGSQTPAQNQCYLASWTKQDTWFDYFSYVPYAPAKNELGHLYGLKTIKFIMSGCLKVMVNDPGNANADPKTGFVTKTTGTATCGTQSASYTPFTAEQDYSIFDQIGNAPITAAPGLASLLQQMKSSNMVPLSTFQFNNELINSSTHSHIY